MTNENAITTVDDKLNHVHVILKTMFKEKKEALPSDLNQARFLQNALVVLKDVKDINKYNTIDISRTIMKAAVLNLDFMNGECYAIPYGGQLRFQTDYKGEKKLAKKYSINPIKDIYAKIVREGDEFDESITDGRQSLNFKPKPFNNGRIIGAFAVALFHDGQMMLETMSTEEIEDVRKNYSSFKDSKAWKNSSGEMYKKTVCRRLTKHIELDLDSVQKEAWQDGSGFEFKNNNQVKQRQQATSSLDKFDKVIEIEANVTN